MTRAAAMETWPRWMPLKMASHYGNIGIKRLKQLAADGSVRGFKDPDSGRGDWVFDKLSIDKYREMQTPQIAARTKALELLRSVR